MINQKQNNETKIGITLVSTKTNDSKRLYIVNVALLPQFCLWLHRALQCASQITKCVNTNVKTWINAV